MTYNFVDPKTVLGNAKSQTWKFRVAGDDIDRSFAQRLSCSTIKLKKRLIGYSYLVLGTRSAAKFEQVPSTNWVWMGWKSLCGDIL